jgi:cytochrome c-type biogenesis protein CcmH/NrfG
VITRRDLVCLAAGALAATALFGLYSWRAHSVSGPPVAGVIGGGSAAEAGKAKVVPVEEATRRLAARLQKDGGSREDWRLLGNSYAYLGRRAEADAAFSQAEKVPASPVKPAAAASIGDKGSGP